MYTDEDLNLAVKKGVFTDTSVEEFRNLVSSLNHSPSVDEENFRLIGGFNDIFIVIACALLLFSSWWVLNSISDSNGLGLLVFTGLSWFLAEFFVRRRNMALPAIMLLLAFIGGIFALTLSLMPFQEEVSAINAAAISTIAAYAHWMRFKVPITIAAGTAAVVVLIVSVMMNILPDSENLLLGILFICGLICFAFAMYWDASDTSRTTRKSDVAFWLHLLSAPLIIHPIFFSLGVLDGDESLLTTVIVMVLYVVMTLISITIDRRAFMVSSLAYVLYALSSLFKNYGDVGYSFALTGVFMGAALLLLSAYWHPVRKQLLAYLPERLQALTPKVKLA